MPGEQKQGSQHVVADIIDKLIEQGVILEEHRELAIECLDRELRRNTERLLARFASGAVHGALVEKSLPNA